MNDLWPVPKQPVTHRFAQGELFSYLGRQYPLHIQYDCNIKRACVALSGDRLVIQTPLLDKKLLTAAVTLWYRENALKLMTQRAAYFAPQVGRRPEAVIVREQKSRWGSCNSKGELRLNWKLIMAPPGALDYVIVHELCHLHEMNHSPRFWSHVAAVMPEYRQSRQWLKDYGMALEFIIL